MPRPVAFAGSCSPACHVARGATSGREDRERSSLLYEDGSGLAGVAILAEHRFDAAHGLAQAVLVFDQRKTHVLVAVFPETDSRRHGYLGPRQTVLRELQRAE